VHGSPSPETRPGPPVLQLPAVSLQTESSGNGLDTLRTLRLGSDDGQPGSIPFRKAFVEQKHAFLDMSRMGSDGYVGQPQETLRGHSGNLQAVELLRFDLGNNLLDCPAGRFL